MSPTHSQRVNIMSEVLWFRTLRMYFIPLFPTTKAWEVYQENTCAFSFCFFSITSVIDHWQGFSAEPGGPLFWVSLQVSCTKRELASLVTHQELRRLLSEQDIGFKGQKNVLLCIETSHLGSQILVPLPGSALHWEQLSKLF